VHTCLRMHASVFMQVCICLLVCVYECMYVYACACGCARAHACAYVLAQACMCTHLYVCLLPVLKQWVAAFPGGTLCHIVERAKLSQFSSFSPDEQHA